MIFSGNNLGSLYFQQAQAFSNALMNYISGQDSLEAALISGGISNADLADLPANAGLAGIALFDYFRVVEDQIDGVINLSPSDLETQALAAYDLFVNSVTSDYPALTDLLSTLSLGAQDGEFFSLVGDFTSAVDGTDASDWFFLSGAADNFYGGLDADVLFGLGGNDNLFGGADSDDLFGGTGDDNLTGGPGEDGIFGGEGAGDVANFLTSLGQFTLQFLNDGTVIVQDRAADGEGTDTLTGIETLNFGGGASVFADGSVNLGQFQGISGLSPEQIITFIELYIAYFNRAPDAIGLNFWGSAFAGGVTLPEIAALFLDQDETRATYPSDMTNLEFATEVYENVLGRLPDIIGLDFWVGLLDAGEVGRDTFILEVLAGTRVDLAIGASAEDIALQLADREYLTTKTDIGNYFAVIRGLSDVQDASAAMELFQRGSEGSIQDAIAFIDQEYASALAEDSGEVLMQLVGVVDDPFAV